MARVFDKPHYKGEALDRFLFLRDPERFESSALIAACGVDIELETEVAYMLGRSEDHEEKLQSKAYEFGIGKDAFKVVRTFDVVSAALRKIVPDSDIKRIVSDSHGAIALFGMYLRGEAHITRARDTNMSATEEAAREIAAIGMMASFATPKLCSPATRALRMYSYLCREYPQIADMWDCAEGWRMSVASSKARDHLRVAVSGDEELDIEQLKISEGSWYRHHAAWESYIVLGISIHKIGGKVFVFDNNTRSQLHDVLVSAPQWVLYGCNHRNPRAESAAYAALLYIGSALKKMAVVDCEHLAAQMKKSYAVVLAHYQSEGAGSTDEMQEIALGKMARDSTHGEDPWFETILKFDDELAVDFGTAWNLMPGVDIDPRALASSVQKKMEAPKEFVEATWEEFMIYSAGAITAHIIYSQRKPADEYEWECAPDGPPEWAVRCADGTLTYPGDGDRARIRRALKWEKTLEWWHFKAQDVTHIFADRARYESRYAMGTSDRADSNELLYAMKHGSMLSGKYTPAEVREAAERGEILGDPVIAIAGKGENTKVGAKARETGSADDVRRELISEGEVNVRRLARLLDGATCGMSRQQLESAIHRILSGASKDAVLEALDFEGWSPNAVRKWHMRFQQLLYSFFDTKLDARLCFVNPTMVLSHGGVHTLWTSNDGSLQGFWGSGDTILNSLMLQFAFHREKGRGSFIAESRIRKVTLIDDVLALLSQFGMPAFDAMRRMIVHMAELGYKAEVLKTLLSHVKGHFLNRLYSERQEVITSAKIFAKANREYERQFTTVWERVDSVFGSFLGAADRGADPVMAYTFAIHRSLAVMKACAHRLSFDTAIVTLATAFLPRQAMGWGLPAFAQWVTREATSALGSGFSVVAVVADILEDSDPRACAALRSLLRAISLEVPVDRSVMAVAEDPFQVALPDVINPSTPVLRLYKIALSRAVTAPEFLRLTTMGESSAYARNLERAIRASEWPAAILAEWCSSLPHAVVRGVMATAESNEAVLVYTSVRERARARGELNRLNALAVRGVEKYSRSVLVGNEKRISASDVLARLMKTARMSDALPIRDSYIPGVLDSIRQSAGAGAFEVSMPTYTASEMFNRVPGGGIRRTITSENVVESSEVEGDRADPVFAAYLRMSGVSSIVRAYGGDPTPLETFWALAWTGDSEFTRCIDIQLNGANPIRLAQRVARRNNSVFGWPNAVRGVSVNAHSAIQQFEAMSVKTPFLSVVFTLKAAALLDIRLGCYYPEGATRYYNFASAHELFAHTTYPSHAQVPVFEEMVCALEGPLAEALRVKQREYTYRLGAMGDAVFGMRGVAVLGGDSSAFAVLSARSTGHTAGLLTRLGGVSTKLNEFEKSRQARADVEVPVRGQSRGAIVADLAEDQFSRDAIGLVIDIGMLNGDDNALADLVTRATALLRDAPAWVARNGIALPLREFVTTGGAERHKFARALAVSGAGDRKYFENMAADYERRSREMTRTAKVRYWAMYMQHIMLSCAGEQKRKPDVALRVGSIVAGVNSATENLLFQLDAIGPGLSSSVDYYLAHMAGQHVRVRGGLARGLSALVSDALPTDFSQRDQVIGGAFKAVSDAELFLEADILVPQAVKEGSHVRGMGPVEVELTMPEVQFLGMDLPPTDHKPALGPEHMQREFLASMGIFEGGIDENMYEDYKQWQRTRGMDI